MADNAITELPDEIGQLCRLEVLDMAQNSIAELPEEIGMLCMLQVFDTSDNRLRRLSVSLWSVDSLSELIIAGNPLDSVGEASMVKPTGVIRRLILPVDMLSLFDLASLPSLSHLKLMR